MTPLARSLERLDPDADQLEGRIAPAPPGWLSARGVANDPDGMDALREAALAGTGPADVRTVGVMMMWRYADVARVATTLYRLDQRVPELEPASVAFLPFTARDATRVALASAQFACLPDDPAVDHPDADPVAELDALRSVLVRRIEAYIEPAIGPMSRATHLGAKALWGIAASAVLAHLPDAYAEDGDPEDGVAELSAILTHASRLASAPPSVEIVLRRGAHRLVLCHGICCRAYRWPDGDHETCASCPLRPRHERVAMQLARFDP